MTVPVVVATAQKGDLPVYLIGRGTDMAFNTVTVRSRVDGQIVKVNFTEGQFVHAGDALIGHESAYVSAPTDRSARSDVGGRMLDIETVRSVNLGIG